MSERYDSPDEAYANYLAGKAHAEELAWQEAESREAETKAMAENKQNEILISRQLARNQLGATFRLYYQVDLIVKQSNFDAFVDRLIQEWETDVESAIKWALSELADDIKVEHPDLKAVENSKIFLTEPMPTGEDYHP